MSLFSAESGKRAVGGGGGAGLAVVVQFDGGSRGNPGPAGIGVTLAEEGGTKIYELGEYLGHCTNNVAEYTALVRGLGAAKALRATKVTVKADSELVVRQINGIYKVKSPDLKPLYQQAVALIESMGGSGAVKVVHVYREGNTRADELANLAMDREAKIEPLGKIENGVVMKPARGAVVAEEGGEAMIGAVEGVAGLRGAVESVRLEVELSLREFSALLLVGQSPGITQSEVCGVMALSDGAVYKAVCDGLMLQHKLVRQGDSLTPDEPRGFYLTVRGKGLLEKAVKASQAKL